MLQQYFPRDNRQHKKRKVTYKLQYTDKLAEQHTYLHKAKSHRKHTEVFTALDISIITYTGRRTSIEKNFLESCFQQIPLHLHTTDKFPKGIEGLQHATYPSAIYGSEMKQIISMN